MSRSCSRLVVLSRSASSTTISSTCGKVPRPRGRQPASGIRRIAGVAAAEEVAADLAGGDRDRGGPEHGAGGVQPLGQVEGEPVEGWLLLVGEVILGGVPVRVVPGGQGLVD